MITPWKDYLSPRWRAADYRRCHRRCGSAFKHQRARIERVLEAMRPRVVACLGAGVLNDIPYTSFVEAGATVHLVDWLPDVTQFGVAHAIVQGTRSGSPQCAYCRIADIDPRDYCCTYHRTERSRTGVCEAFEASPDEPECCLGFEKGRLPYLHQEDVTGGYASAFGARIGEELRGAGSWRQAFRRANSLAIRIKRHECPLSIADASVDLVISSMVISQFEHEPYAYFSRQTAALLGPPGPQEEKRLQPAMEKLRASLLDNQVEGHCEEIERILAPGGRCYLAFEMFHSGEGQTMWYLVDGMHGALTILARHFGFDIDGCPGPVADTESATGGGRSVVYNLLLAPKAQ